MRPKIGEYEAREGGVTSNQRSYCRQLINYLIQLLSLKRIKSDGSSCHSRVAKCYLSTNDVLANVTGLD